MTDATHRARAPPRRRPRVGRRRHPQRGPKREMSVERIVEAAIEIADAEGLGGRVDEPGRAVARLHDDVALPLRHREGRPDPAHAGGGDRLSPEPDEAVDDWRARSARRARAARAHRRIRGCSTSRSRARRSRRTASHGWTGSCATPCRTCRSTRTSESAIILRDGSYAGSAHRGRPRGRRRRARPPTRSDRRRARSSILDERRHRRARSRPPRSARSTPASRRGTRSDTFAFGSARILDGIADHIAHAWRPPRRRSRPEQRGLATGGGRGRPRRPRGRGSPCARPRSARDAQQALERQAARERAARGTEPAR